MKLYEVSYDIKRNRRETHFSKYYKAANAEDAREKFDSAYYGKANKYYTPPHAFHVKVRRLMNGVKDEYVESV